jgi:hypothetical protein
MESRHWNNLPLIDGNMHKHATEARSVAKSFVRAGRQRNEYFWKRRFRSRSTFLGQNFSSVGGGVDEYIEAGQVKLGSFSDFLRTFYETTRCHITLHQYACPLLKRALQYGFFNGLKNRIKCLQRLIGLLE